MGQTPDSSMSLDAAIRAKLYGTRAFRCEMDCVDCALDREVADAAIVGLLAVLDQHKPRALTDDECFMRRVLPKTVICLGDHGRGSILDETYYPCRTVKAIAAGLGLEQPHV